MKKVNAVIGDKYGKWLVLEEERKIGLHWQILCSCDCGEKRFIRITRLVNGGSLGCNRCASGTLKHGHRRDYKLSPEYIAWNNMRIRCYCRSSKDYNNYGGRGIKVCSRWRYSFKNFLSDMGSKPTRFHSLDRKENDGNYEPMNCRWGTAIEQRANQRRNKSLGDVVKL